MAVLTLAACDTRRAASAPDAGSVADSMAQPVDGRVAPDSSGASCAGLTGYLPGKKVASFQTRQALIGPGLKRAWLLSHRDNTDGDLYMLDLPTGKLVKRAAGIQHISWLGKSDTVAGGVRAKGAAGKKGHYHLFGFVPGVAKPMELSGEICAHLASDDGKQLFRLSACSDNKGVLMHCDLAAGTGCKQVDTGVSRWGLSLAPGPSVLSYRKQIVSSGGCKQGTGSLHLYHLKSATKAKVADGVVAYGTRFTPDGKRLLLRQVLSCNPSKERLSAADMTSAAPVTLTDKAGYGYFGHLDPLTGAWTLAVSPDSSRVLVADLDMAAGKQNKLVSVRTDGKGEQVLASDLYPYQMVSAALMVWAYSADGKHVVYLSGDSTKTMNLSTVPATGGKARLLGSGLGWSGHALSRTGARTAFIQRGAGPGNQLLAADLNSAGAAKQLLTSTQPMSGVGFVPDASGVLVLERSTGGDETLRHVAFKDARATTLGAWKTRYYQNRQPYSLDETSCLVLHNRQQAGASGTFIRVLPR